MATFSLSTYTSVGLALYLGALLYLATRYVSYTLRKRSERRNLSQQHQCKPVQKQFPHRDPLLGLDLFFSNAVAATQHRFLETVTRRHDEVGETYQLNMLGTVGIMTRDHEIIKSVLSTHFKDYSLQPERKAALRPLLGNGIFSTDGPSWSHSRAILRPQFTRAQLLDLSMLENHVTRLLALIPPWEEIELHSLLLRFTMDVATDFMFGHSTASTHQGAAAAPLSGFAESVAYAQHRIAMTMALGRWAFLFPDRQFTRHVRAVHGFIDGFVSAALREHDTKPPGRVPDTPAPKPYVLLHALVEEQDGVKDPVRIRDELVNILIAGRDTTASLISTLFFVLSRRPDIWAKLRDEVRQFEGGRPPKFEEIPLCRYLRWTINESLRLYPPVPVNARVAVTDTVLPRGGGADGTSPVLVTAGTPVVYNIHGLHRRRDIYGSDADDFRPDRWEGLRVGWEFLPFSGGPRICIGQQFAITEASYVLIRFLQRFETVECRDPRPWREKLGLTVSCLDGVRVVFKGAE